MLFVINRLYSNDAIGKPNNYIIEKFIISHSCQIYDSS